MKALKIVLFALLLGALLGCSKDEEEDNLHVIFAEQFEAGASVDIYSLADTNYPILTGELDRSGKFHCRLNAGDYQMHLKKFKFCNFQIQKGRTTRIVHVPGRELVIEYK